VRVQRAEWQEPGPRRGEQFAGSVREANLSHSKTECLAAGVLSARK